jgi:NADH-quinone oxidoreductase subunit M
MTLLILLPLLGALAVAVLPSGDARAVRRFAFGMALLPLVWSVWLWAGAAGAEGGPFLEVRHAWIPSLGIEWRLGLDGISFVFVLLAGVVTPFAIAASGGITRSPRAYFALVLALQGMLYGVFMALNFIPWFVFWELSLIPAYLLIRLWGGGQAPGAALKFFLMTLAGGLLMLAGFLALSLAAGTFDFGGLAALARDGSLAPRLAETFPAMGTEAAGWIFLGVLAGLAVKVPMIPLHTWLPSAYAEAPAPVTMLLTGVMSKMGIYGMLRILLPIFPHEMAAVATPLLWLAVATIVLSALAALRQTDLRRMLAYSSINHLGYCLLGIFAVAGVPAGADMLHEQSSALAGVLLQVFNHGIIASTLFCCAGLLEARSGGLRGIDDFGGLRSRAPVFAGLTGIALFASLGLPGLSGFVGEFLIFKSAFALEPVAAAVSTAGLLVTAVFLLRIQRRVFHGPVPDRWSAFPDLDFRERVLLAPTTALVFLLGIWPRPLLDIFNPAILHLLESLPLP